MNGITFDPLLPPALLGALGIGLFAATIYVYLLTGSRLGRRGNAILISLRLIAITAVLLLLLQPSRRESVPFQKIQKVLLIGIDTSRSMRQPDAGGAPRLEAAKSALREAQLLSTDPGLGAAPRFFEFGEDAIPIPAAGVPALKADGVSTRFHRVIEGMLSSLSAGETASGLVLLTDGHDFELTSPLKTAAMARERRVPIYAVPFGDQGFVRDVSVRINNYEPYSYVKQKARIDASVRVIGCEHEDLTVQLLRKDRVIKTIRANAGEEAELPFDFEVTEPEVGQYEYEVRVLPLPRQTEIKNNSAITYLNVIDQQIRVLLLEGAPGWDTTFLRRSLFQNDKINLDAIVQYTNDKARRIRKSAAAEARDGKDLKLPTTQSEFNAYDIIILGRSIDRFFDAERFKMLVSFVKYHGGTVIFSRGQAFGGELAIDNELDPVLWGNAGEDRVQLEVRREGRMLSPFQVLAGYPGGVGSLPPLLAARQTSDRKVLAAMLADAHDPDGGAPVPGIIHRRYGRGQVLSVAVDGLWRWSFNPKSAGANNIFDRFWDQLLLWLAADGDISPSQQFSFRASTANVLLGTKLNFRLASRDGSQAPKQTAVTIYHDDAQVARTVMAPRETDDASHLTGDYLPEKTGRYRAVVSLPDGTQQEVKWIVFDENLEEKEVAADVPYLRQLCESSGGKVISPEDLARLRRNLQRRDTEFEPKVKLTSLWDQTWIFYAIGAALGLDWFLRRRWGLC